MDNSYLYSVDCQKDATIRCTVVGSSPAAGSVAYFMLTSSNAAVPPVTKGPSTREMFVISAAQLTDDYTLQVFPAALNGETTSVRLAVLQGNPSAAVGGYVTPPHHPQAPFTPDANGDTTASTNLANGDQPAYPIGFDCP
jgi:hypothetical protein